MVNTIIMTCLERRKS